EIMALRAGAEYLGNYRLPGTQLYVTVEPCVMCLGAIIHARVAQVIFGATEPKAGALISRPLAEQDHFNHFPEITVGPLGESCGRLMSDFFANRRLDKRGPKPQPVGS
ncbi:MAG: nucleoside deaminase, partial [Pseudomonadota bacterium]|nr:nucleoside deaminase [Pseudomonadota bacterium]